MEKVIIRTKSIESRDKIFELITKGLNRKWCNVPGGYSLDKRCKDRNDMNYVGVFCERITIYYD
mgnify:CR=1 FL=1